MLAIFQPILRAKSLCSKCGGRCRSRGVRFRHMKKLLLIWVIAGAALAGMAGCAQIKKPAAQVRAVPQVCVSTKSARSRCIPASRARRKSCSIFTARDRRSGSVRRSTKRKYSLRRQRITGEFIFLENGDVADNRTVATLKSRVRN